MPSTLDWLRGRTDAELADLLTQRPGLLVPAPGDLAALARRLDSPSTARRAVEMLDAFELAVVQALLLLDAVRHSEPPEAIADLLGGPADAADVQRAADRVQTLALIRGDGDGFRLTPAARDALGRFPAGLGAPTGITSEQIADALAQVDGVARGLLQRLVPGPPVGTVEPGSPHAEAVARLVRLGLLVRIDERTVTLPREVALVLRGRHPLGPALPVAPELEVAPHEADAVDGTAAGQALAAHARAVRLLDIFGGGQVASLKAGGIGILALRRIARELDLSEQLTALHVELLAQVGLIAQVSPRSGAAGSWIPTQTADTFTSGTEAAGWSLLADAWLQMRREPARIGTRDATDKLCNVLSSELSWRTGPTERRRVLGELAALPPGHGADATSLSRRLAYRSPLRDRQVLGDRVAAVLAEGTELGLVAFDALSTAGRAVLAEDMQGAATALEQALPAPMDTVLVQADMTVVAPGRLTSQLAGALSRAADVESAGGGTVYRISEASLRRALDAGATGVELHELFEKHSATPVPQSLSYLIDDVARRHGALRAGSAGAYLRCEDPALITQAVATATAAGLDLRALAPTVAVSSSDVATLVETLRTAGLASAAEDARGSVLDLTPRPRRTRVTPPARQHYSEPSPPSAEQIAGVVRRLRAGEAATLDSQHPRDVLTVLRQAARHHTAVWIGYADAQGSTSRRIVEPIMVSGGSMVAFDRLRNAPRTFVVHRISSVHPDAE